MKCTFKIVFLTLLLIAFSPVNAGITSCDVIAAAADDGTKKPDADDGKKKGEKDGKDAEPECD